MQPWYKIATPRKEVREGRSFDPSEFAIHVAREAPRRHQHVPRMSCFGCCRGNPVW